MAEQAQGSRAFCPVPFEGPSVRLASLLDTFRKYCTSNTPNRMCDADIADDIGTVISSTPTQVLNNATLDGCIVLVPASRRNRNLEPLFMCSQFLQPGKLERPSGSNSLRFLFSGSTSGVFSTDIARECVARNRVCSSIGPDQPLGLGFALPTGAAGRESGETMLLHGCLQSGAVRRCSFIDLGVAPGAPSNRATTIATVPQFAWCGTAENPRPVIAQALALLATATPVTSSQPWPTPAVPISGSPLPGSGRSTTTAAGAGSTATSSSAPVPSDAVNEQSGGPSAQVTAGIIGLIAILSGAALAAFALFLVRRRHARLAKQEAAQGSSTYGTLARRKSSVGSIHSFGAGAGGMTFDGTGHRRTSLTPLASMHTVSTSDPMSPTKKSARYDTNSGPLSPALPTVGLTRLPLAALISRPLDEVLSAPDPESGPESQSDLIDAFDAIFTDLESHIISQLVCPLPTGIAPTPSPASATSTFPRPLSAMSVRTSNHQRAVRLAFATSALLSAVRGRSISPGLVPDSLIPAFQALLQRMVRFDPGSSLVMIAAGQSALRYSAMTRVYHAAEGAMVSVMQGGEEKGLVRHTAVVEATCFPGWVGADGKVAVTARASIS